MKCDFKIMGVEERIENIKQTVNVLNLSMDDVFLDKEMRMNHIRSSLDVLRMPVEKGITHRCILQDDIILSDNFSDFVNKLIAIAPDAIYSLIRLQAINLTEKRKNIKDGRENMGASRGYSIEI